MGSCSCKPTFSAGYSSGPSDLRLLGPAVVTSDPTAMASPSYCSLSRSSLGTPIYFDSRFDRSNLIDGLPTEPPSLTSHHRLEGRPLESDPSRASLTLILGIGDKDGLYWFHHVVSGAANAGDAGTDPDDGSDCNWGLSCCVLAMIELLCDLLPGPVDESGVQPLVRDTVDSRRELLYGRKRSRVSSKISEPMPSIAEAYLSLRIRDSVTMNSANIRTRSPSVAAAASFCENAWCRSMAARAKCSAGEAGSWSAIDCRDVGRDRLDGPADSFGVICRD